MRRETLAAGLVAALTGTGLIVYLRKLYQHSVSKMEKPAKRARVEEPVHVLSYVWKPDNVFAAIQASSIPAERLYDLQHTYALLDQRPISRGHCLVITKHPVSTLCQGLPAAALADTLSDVQTMAQAVQRATDCSGVMIRQNNGPAGGQTVPQLHFHIIPAYSSTPLSDTTTPDSSRPLLETDQAGALSAAIQNALPKPYSQADCHAWVPSADAMEELGMSLLNLCVPGTVICLNGHLGTGKTSIARGAVRAFCQDPNMFVPSPTFLLNLSYTQDTGHEPRPDPSATSSSGLTHQHAKSIHHMDPYRLGKADKMAGLIDFTSAFQEDICVIEWPDRMPASVMALPRNRTLVVNISGTGAQAAGRLVHISLVDSQEAAAAAVAAEAAAAGRKAGMGGGKGGKGKAAAGPGTGTAGDGIAAQGSTVAAAAVDDVAGARVGGASSQSAADTNGPSAEAAAGYSAFVGGPSVQSPSSETAATAAAAADALVHEVLSQWRVSGLPKPQVAWKAVGEGEGGNGGGAALGPGSSLQLPAGPPESYVVLGVESSCDDTAAAVVRGDGTVLAHKIASQVRRGGGGRGEGEGRQRTG